MATVAAASVRGLLPRPFREYYRRKLLLDRAYPHGWVPLLRGRSQRHYGAKDVKFTFLCPLRWEDLSESGSRSGRERLCDACGTYVRHGRWNPLELSDIEDAASAPCRSVPATSSLRAGPSLDFTDAEIARYKNAFIDAKGASGKLPIALLGEALRRAGKDVSEDELRAMLIDVDTDGNGCVDFAEFLSLFAARMGVADNDAEAELLAGIARLDVAGDGRVSIAEMRGFLIHDQGCYEQEVDEIFADVAAGAAIRDGLVDYKMLVSILLTL